MDQTQTQSTNPSPDPISTSNQTPLPNPESQPIQKDPQPKSSKLLIIILILIAVSASGIAAYFFYQYQQLVQQLTEVPSVLDISNKPQLTATPESESDPTSGWTLYSDPVLNISYKLPLKLGLLESSGIETPGDTGTQYCLVYQGSLTWHIIDQAYAGVGPCGGGDFNIGTVTNNYGAGREGGFGDITGYVKEGERYFSLFISSKVDTALPPNLISESTNKNGVTYLEITGANDIYDRAGEQMSLPIPGTPGEGYIGALINLPTGSKYPGINISMKTSSPEDQKIFDQILSTFEFIDSDQFTTYEVNKTPLTNYSSFIISYPKDFVLTHKDDYSDSDWLTIEKDNHILHIYQPAIGGGVCEYSDSQLPDDHPLKTSIIFTEYEEINSVNVTYRLQLAPKQENNKTTYSVCEKPENAEYFQVPPQAGIITISVPTSYDPEIFSSLKNIISSINYLD